MINQDALSDLGCRVLLTSAHGFSVKRSYSPDSVVMLLGKDLMEGGQCSPR